MYALVATLPRWIDFSFIREGITISTKYDHRPHKKQKIEYDSSSQISEDEDEEEFDPNSIGFKDFLESPFIQNGVLQSIQFPPIPSIIQSQLCLNLKEQFIYELLLYINRFPNLTKLYAAQGGYDFRDYQIPSNIWYVSMTTASHFPKVLQI